MQDYMYAIIGVIAIIIHIIINPGAFRFRSLKEEKNKAYFFLLMSIFIYYITDMFWGLLAGLNNIPALFIDTTVYYVAMASAVVCWCIYIIEYLNLNNYIGRVLKWFGWTFFYTELFFLTVNFFYPCFFWFDENDAYQAGYIRYAALIIQIVLFFITVVITGLRALRVSGITRKRHVAIFLFSLVMLVANSFQTLYPLLPIYAMGCLIGSCILHVYVVEDEREEYRQIIAEEKNIAEAASLAKTTFLFNMSHDIRTPMNAILGYTDIAIKHMDDREKVDDSLSKIKTAGVHLLDIINDILEMSRIESGKLEIAEDPMNLVKLIEGVDQMSRSLAIEKSIDFRTESGDIINPYVYYDQLHANELLINLISNAIKYTPMGGRVRFRARQLTEVTDGRATYRFDVEDNGIGMSEEFQKHLFEAFSREKTSTVSRQQGTGLGLSIVKRIVDMSGGTISVHSNQNTGSVFTVEIALRVMDEDAVRSFEEAGKPLDIREESFSFENKKVLLVEDNEMNRDIATEILTEAGFSVETAEDGEFAVQAVRKRGTDYFDFILMDIQMPVMDGYTATKAIRALQGGEKLRIIALSANAYAEDVQRSIESGMDAHVSKPIDVKNLFEVLSSLAKQPVQP